MAELASRVELNETDGIMPTKKRSEDKRLWAW
jgi:hypothetical protein